MLLTHADRLAAYLLTVPGLSGLAVLVDRQQDLRSAATIELEKKTAGAVATLSLAGWAPISGDSSPDTYWATLRYELALVMHPTIMGELDMPAPDELLRRLVMAIHATPAVPGANVDPYGGDRRWRVGQGNYAPDDAFLVYLFTAQLAEDFATAS